METQEPDESRPGAGEAPSKGGASSSRELVPDVMRLMGKGVGITQRICTKTVDGVVSAGRRTGTFVIAPLTHLPSPIKTARKKREAKPDRANESSPASTAALYSRIGDQLCSLVQVDPSYLLRCLQKDVSVVAERNETDGITALTLRLSGDAEEATDRSESIEKPVAHEEAGVSGPAVSEDDSKNLRDELAEVRAKLEQAEQLISRIHANEIEARETLHQKEEKLAAISGDLEEARRRADDARSKSSAELGALRSEKESSQAELAEAHTAVDAARSTTEALETDLASAQGALEEARKQLEESRSESSARLAALQSENDSLQTELTDARSETEVAMSLAEDLEAELSRLRASSESASEGDQVQSQPDCDTGDDTGGGTGGGTGGDTGGGTGGGTGVSPVSHRGPKGSMGILARGTAATPTDSPADEDPASADGPADRPAPGRDVRTDARKPEPQVAEDGLPATARVTAEDVRVAEFAGASERVIFARALSDMDPTTKPYTARARAARNMGGIRHELSARALISQLRDETSANVRKECVRALTTLEAKESLPVIRCALKDEAASVRLAAVRATYRLAGLDGAGALVRMLQDEDEDVKRRAATCLGWLDHKPIAAELVPLLRDENASVRLAGLEALGNLKSSAVLEKIIELLDDPEESVQRRAFHVLGTITGKRMGETFPKDENGRRFLIARWKSWQGRTSSTSKPGMMRPSR